ncbi:hypothetical protein OZZ17_03440 [[Ruminococcus] gnavus]|uniref:Uncharacterized protein n=1 Tax=Mediterraneibacter gnavus TaxID=33038 RepID=A0A9Q4HX27_MEDGN|nr:hypothetical protein [Mediterraneibacter gnavus]MCZ0666590.1 hypothetical protein [Mediterraneibacter gnavus]
MRFNWDEFNDTDNKIAVHCKTEEEAKDFCEKMHKQGMKWCSGESYLKETNYKFCEEEMCYIRGEFSPYQYYKSKGYKILEWSDYMQKEFTKSDLKSGMVVEYNDNYFGKRLVIGGFLIGEDGYSDLGGYNENLKNVASGLEIVRVYKIKCMEKISSIMHDDNLELIWERKKLKKMTVEEMREKLEELIGEEIEIV